MKNRVSILLIFATATLTLSCENDIASAEVASVVVNTFKSNFRDATDVEWETHGDDYEVDFEVDGTDYSARIDKSGTMVEYKYEITHNALPSALISSLEDEYPKLKWEDPEILMQGENAYFQMEIEGFLKDKKLVLDSTGKKIETIKYWN